MSDPLSTSYGDLLEGSYDCVDRVVLNGYFRRGHNAGGFRHWWRDLWGSEEHLDNTHLMRLAARFSRRLRAWAQAHNLPVVYCSAGERKHELAEQYLAQTAITQGLFLILVSRAPAPVWKVVRRGTSPHLERRHPMPYVNHYSFHVLDPDWGHLTIKISGHPPFPAQILLNGHEYVARQACRLGIEFRKEGNCFTLLSDATALAQLAETLLAAATIGSAPSLRPLDLLGLSVLCLESRRATRNRLWLRLLGLPVRVQPQPAFSSRGADGAGLGKAHRPQPSAVADGEGQDHLGGPAALEVPPPQKPSAMGSHGRESCV